MAKKFPLTYAACRFFFKDLNWIKSSISDYLDWNPLYFIEHDVLALRRALERQGFSVFEVNDVDPVRNTARNQLGVRKVAQDRKVTRQRVYDALYEFIAKYGQEERNRLVIYFAGHGFIESFDSREIGYLVMGDALDPKKKRMADEIKTAQTALYMAAISLKEIEALAHRIKSHHALFVFDSCFSGAVIHEEQGLLQAQPDVRGVIARPARVFIASGAKWQLADGGNEFRRSFVTALENGHGDLNGDGFVTGLELGEYLKRSVSARFQGKQTPVYGMIDDKALNQGDIVFAAEKKPAGTLAMFIETTNGLHLEMIEIKGSTIMLGEAVNEKKSEEETFVIGCRSSDKEIRLMSTTNDELLHKVTLSDYAIGRYEVTQAQWNIVRQLPKVRIPLDDVKPEFQGERLPIDSVSWEQAVEFCERLSKLTGKLYRLPTEAEWEFAARAGKPFSFVYGDTLSPEAVNFRGTIFRGSTLPVGDLGQPNEFGLFDLHGNVAEWCLDWYGPVLATAQINPKGPMKGVNKIQRGGSWADCSQDCRLAARGNVMPGSQSSGNGFRLVLDKGAGR